MDCGRFGRFVVLIFNWSETELSKLASTSEWFGMQVLHHATLSGEGKRLRLNHEDSKERKAH